MNVLGKAQLGEWQEIRNTQFWNSALCMHNPSLWAQKKKKKT